MLTDDDRTMSLEIGARLAVLRQYLGHTPGSFAATLGVTRRAYLEYERGKRVRWGDFARVLSERTGVSLDWLFSGCRRVELRSDERPLFSDGRARRPVLHEVGT